MRFLVICFLLTTQVVAQEHTDSENTKLIIATRSVPPFAFQDEQGRWTGISIDLWREIAKDSGLDYEFRDTSLQEMIDGVATGEYDAAVAALTMNAERENRLDFTHPFMDAGLGIAVRSAGTGGTSAVLQRLFSLQFFEAVGLLVLVLFLVGVGIWLIENRKNEEQFGGGWLKGIGNGFWWSATTMTTVGYGDKAPCTPWGRVLGVVWMFSGILTISAFTAAITSAVTVSQLETEIDSVSDLSGNRVAVVRDSTGAAFLKEHLIPSIAFEDAETALKALDDDKIDAVVYDAPVMRYLDTQREFANVDVLPGTITNESYGIALPSNSIHREAINRLVLEKTTADEWRDVLYRYLGQ